MALMRIYVFCLFFVFAFAVCKCGLLFLSAEEESAETEYYRRRNAYNNRQAALGERGAEEIVAFSAAVCTSIVDNMFIVLVNTVFFYDSLCIFFAYKIYGKLLCCRIILERQIQKRTVVIRNSTAKRRRECHIFGVFHRSVKVKLATKH